MRYFILLLFLIPSLAQAQPLPHDIKQNMLIYDFKSDTLDIANYNNGIERETLYVMRLKHDGEIYAYVLRYVDMDYYAMLKHARAFKFYAGGYYEIDEVSPYPEDIAKRYCENEIGQPTDYEFRNHPVFQYVSFKPHEVVYICHPNLFDYLASI